MVTSTHPAENNGKPGLLKVYNAIEGFFNKGAIWLIMGLMFVTVADIILRAISGKSIPGGYELVELMLGGCFLAISYTQKQKGHVKMDLVLVNLPKRARYICDLAALLISLIICVIIFTQTLGYTGQAIEMNLTTAGVVSYPLWPTRMVLSLGFLLISIRIVIQLIDMVLNRSDA